MYYCKYIVYVPVKIGNFFQYLESPLSLSLSLFQPIYIYLSVRL